MINQPDINLSDFELEPFYEQNVLRGYLLKKKGLKQMSKADTNQASEDRLRKNIEHIILTWSSEISGQPREKLHPETDQFVMRLVDLIRTEKLKLLAEIDKSMPTAEQLTTKYGYHMPDKQYGYKLALHDIREALTKLEAEL